MAPKAPSDTRSSALTRLDLRARFRPAAPSHTSRFARLRQNGLPMEIFRVSVPVPYGVVLIGDPAGHAPEVAWSRTSSCVAVGCTPDVDGETEFIVLVDGMAADQMSLGFDGELDLPTQMFAIRTVDGVTIFDLPMQVSRIGLRVWADHATEPSRVVVAIDEHCASYPIPG